MCLSSVYTVQGEVKELVGKNIASVEEKDGKFVLTDLLGIPTMVEGTIEKVDLLENTITIRKN